MTDINAGWWLTIAFAPFILLYIVTVILYILDWDFKPWLGLTALFLFVGFFFGIPLTIVDATSDCDEWLGDFGGMQELLEVEPIYATGTDGKEYQVGAMKTYGCIDNGVILHQWQEEYYA